MKINIAIISVLVFTVIALSLRVSFLQNKENPFTLYEAKSTKDSLELVNLKVKYDSVVKFTDSKIDTFIKIQIKNHFHYDTIYLNINNLTYDSAIQLRSIERGQFRSFYGY